MRFPDWRAYETGELPAQERADADALLGQSEEARQDYAGYQEFKAALRQAAVSDQMSFDRLDAMLRHAVGRRPLPRFLAPLMAGFAVIAIAVAIGPRLIRQDSPVPPARIVEPVAHLQTADPKEAYTWIGKNVGFMIPEYRLTETAKLTGASVGKGWGAYEYEMDGKPMKLVVRPNAYEFKGASPKTVGRTTFYVNESVGFKCPYCAYELTGGDEKARWKLAKAAATELFGGL